MSPRVDPNMPTPHDDSESVTFAAVPEALATFTLAGLPSAYLRYLGEVAERFELPTTLVVKAPAVVAPREGRIYATDWLEIQGRLAPKDMYREYLGQVQVAEVGGHEVFLVEVYADEGGKGRPDFRQQGWAMMTRRQYRDYLERLLGER